MMAEPKPTLGYRTRTAACIELARQGRSNAEIARMVGTSPKVVSAVLGRRLEKCPKAPRSRRPSEAGMRTVSMPIDVLDALKPTAERRGITANELVRRLVEAAVDDGLIDGILDDAEEIAA